MHILVSFCNAWPVAGGMPKLGLLDTATSDFRVLELPDSLARWSGITGLALSEDFVYAVVQDKASHLAVFDRATLALRGLHSLPAMEDVHSLWLEDDALFAVSTGTDEVVRLRLRGAAIDSSEVYWRPDPGAPREDIHHLNAILRAHGDLYVSGFGRKAGKTWGSAKSGVVLRLTDRKVMASEIVHPHSLALIGDALACCESRDRTVRILGGDRSAQLPGYTRGMCVIGESVYVGTCTQRRVSKSAGTVNAPGAAEASEGRCTICRLSARGLAVEDVVDLSAYAYEIYDLVPADRVAGWPAIPEGEWQDGMLRRFMALQDEQHALAIQQAAAADEARRSLADLQLEREELKRLLVETRRELDRRTAEQTTTIDQLHGQLDHATRVVADMQRTRLWRLGTAYWRARDRLRRLSGPAT
ncbi:MAG TPA: DUF4915 domain-containing protein [Thermomicrobiales bacterium]|nr:DUF4915 domain-containing protein [Thermomicrobiales bacterium]